MPSRQSIQRSLIAMCAFTLSATSAIAGTCDDIPGTSYERKDYPYYDGNIVHKYTLWSIPINQAEGDWQIDYSKTAERFNEKQPSMPPELICTKRGDQKPSSKSYNGTSFPDHFLCEHKSGAKSWNPNAPIPFITYDRNTNVIHIDNTYDHRSGGSKFLSSCKDKKEFTTKAFMMRACDFKNGLFQSCKEFFATLK